MDLDAFLRKGLLVKDNTAIHLSANYLAKAHTNLITMELLSSSTRHRTVLALPADYSPDEWVVVVAYYAMYMAALSVLVRLGYRSKNHTATALALENMLVKSRLLDPATSSRFAVFGSRRRRLGSCPARGIAGR